MFAEVSWNVELISKILIGIFMSRWNNAKKLIFVSKMILGRWISSVA